MAQVEPRLATQEDAHNVAPSVGEVLALVDALRNGPVNASQREIVDAVRAGIATLMK